MKKLVTAILVLLALAGCSKQQADEVLVPIEPSAGVAVLVKAPVNGTKFPSGTNAVFSSTAYGQAAAPTGNYQSVLFNNVAVNTDASGRLSYASRQYYPANGNPVFFYGWAPGTGAYTTGTASATPKVAFTLTGQEDIMHGLDVTTKPSRIGGQPVYQFSHKLKQVQFKAVAGTGYPVSGTSVKSITINGTQIKPTLDVVSGNLTWDAATTGNLTAFSGAQPITGTASAAFGAVMFKEGSTFNITVVTTTGGTETTYANVPVTLADGLGKAGTCYTVTLTFKIAELQPTATISGWVEVAFTDVDVK